MADSGTGTKHSADRISALPDDLASRARIK